MGINQHVRRHRIFNPSQHPLVHDISAFGYSNGALPGVSLLGDALDYLVAALYPKYTQTVADQTALNAIVSPAINDYVIVSDDGDGRAAGYVWRSVEGSASWHKVYDVDWTVEGILGELNNRIQYMYVQKYGMTDRDASGSDIVGTYAGQTIFGGDATGQNLTFNANIADTTGFVQTDNTFRPTANNTLDLGTASLKWRNLYLAGAIASGSLVVGTTTLSSGSLNDSSGSFTFNAVNLATTGTLASGTHTIGTLVLAAGSITDTTVALSFGSTALTTTGNIKCANLKASAGAQIGAFAGSNLKLAQGSITDDSGAISFGAMNLATTGTLGAGVTTVSTINAGNISATANTISTTNSNGDLTLTPNGSGKVNVSSALAVTGNYTSSTGNVTLTSGKIDVGSLELNGSTVSTTSTNTDLTLTPNGTGFVKTTCGIYPGTDASFTLGKTGSRWTNLYLSGAIGDGTSTITIAHLLTFGNVGTPNTNDSLFWDGSKWAASAPDTEITHSTISGLTTGDAGHTQFAMLAGRTGGQTLQGDTATGGNLTLDSTAHATKGSILVGSNVVPSTNASFSATWAGTDLGDSSHYYRDVYTKGVFKNFKLETYTSGTLPSASASAQGRLVWSSDTNSIYVDTGGAWLRTGSGGGGGGSLQWIEDTDAPDSTVDNNLRVYLFGKALTQNVYALVKVPNGYIAGTQLKILITWYSPDSSGTVLISSQATLIRPGTDLVSTTTNQRTSTNAAVTCSGGTANIPQALTLDLTDTAGAINSVAVAAGNLIKVKLFRGTDTATSDVNVPVYGAEVLTS